jgi:hypothetical protein
MMMPEVKKCTVNDCFYWGDDKCRANAIQVGDDHPLCDTYVKAGSHGAPANMGKVGACHTSDCQYNKDLSCSANSIDVGWHAHHADCLTFEAK